MIKNMSFVSGGMVVNADKLERGFGGVCRLINDGVIVGAIDFSFSRLKVLHLYKRDDYINVTYSVYYR